MGLAQTSGVSRAHRPAPVLFGGLAVLALVPVVVEKGGFHLSGGARLALEVAQFAFVGVFALETVLSLRAAPNRREFVRGEWAELLLIGALAIVWILEAFHPFGFVTASGVRSFVIPAQVYLSLNLLLKLLRLFQATSRSRFHHAKAFGLSFLVIIVVGALLLYFLPAARAPGKDLSFVDSVFTATSATCVTGLVTVDTGTEYSRFGQTIVLVLFQLGGLGLMTFAAFFALALGKGMGLQDREVMSGVLNLGFAGTIARIVVGILVVTIVVEGLSTFLLFGRWGPDVAAGDRFFFSLFHAVSAFCNAGFGLKGSSLTDYVRDPVVNLVIMGEIVVGGLGFGVILELAGRAVRPFRRRRPRLDRPVRSPLTVQTRIVLISTAVLIVGGALVLYGLEAGNPRTLGALDTGSRVQAAFFQSITARTAGFNTVPIGDMTEASQFFLIVLMIIGASPGSTGGGVKTVTTVVLLLTVISFYRNRRRVECFRRMLPPDTVNRALVIVVTAIAVISAATLTLSVVEGAKFSFLSVFFEVGSAFGTVGLSTGITAQLSAVSKLTLCVVMLVGRIGPLSLVIALSQGRASSKYAYPEEPVMLG